MKILIICGSPRKGNSEAICRKLHDILKKKGAKPELVLLREKTIQMCGGCVAYCNHKLKCRIKDDMPGLLAKMLKADGYVFVCPNYFKMPPAIFKNFIDRCSIIYTRQCCTKKPDMSKKRALVIAVGADEVKGINVCLMNVTDNFCKTIGIPVVAAKSFTSKSELNEPAMTSLRKITPSIDKDLERMAEKLYKK
jgi:multimeric flavodoxin WrbA